MNEIHIMQQSDTLRLFPLKDYFDWTFQIWWHLSCTGSILPFIRTEKNEMKSNKTNSNLYELVLFFLFNYWGMGELGDWDVILSRNSSSCFKDNPLCSVSSGLMAGTPTLAQGSMTAKLVNTPNPPVDGRMADNSGALELPLITAVLKSAGCWCCCCNCCCCFRWASNDWRGSSMLFKWPGIEYRWWRFDSNKNNLKITFFFLQFQNMVLLDISQLVTLMQH